MANIMFIKQKVLKSLTLGMLELGLLCGVAGLAVPLASADEAGPPMIKGDPAPPVIRDHRTQPGTITSSDTASPPLAQPKPPPAAPATETDGPASVVGGVFEPDYRYPWMVRFTLFACKGVLLDPEWVLTAAHCVKPETRFGEVTYSRTDPHTGAVHTETRPPARVGSETIRNPGVFRHPMYDPTSTNAPNDIALIKVTPAFRITPYLQTVGLPSSPRRAGLIGTIASDSHSAPTPPGQVAVFRAPIPDDPDSPTIHWLSGPDSLASLCVTDSGSGFMTVESGRATVRGIVSEGTSVTQCMTPSGEATLTDLFAYRDWILQTMGKTEASLSGNTRVRWSGFAARGVMSVQCNHSGRRVGPLNVVGIEAGDVCEPGEPRTVLCSLDANQGNVGPMTPRLDGMTIKTTLPDGTSESRSISARRTHPPPGTNVNSISNRFSFPPGAVSQEFLCEIGTLSTPGTDPVVQ